MNASIEYQNQIESKTIILLKEIIKVESNQIFY